MVTMIKRKRKRNRVRVLNGEGVFVMTLTNNKIVIYIETKQNSIKEVDDICVNGFFKLKGVNVIS